LNWHNKTKLIEGKDSIEDIKFCPKEFGLCLASSGSDGIVRIYDPPEKNL